MESNEFGLDGNPFIVQNPIEWKHATNNWLEYPLPPVCPSLGSDGLFEVAAIGWRRALYVRQPHYWFAKLDCGKWSQAGAMGPEILELENSVLEAEPKLLRQQPLDRVREQEHWIVI